MQRAGLAALLVSLCKIAKSAAQVHDREAAGSESRAATNESSALSLSFSLSSFIGDFLAGISTLLLASSCWSSSIPCTLYRNYSFYVSCKMGGGKAKLERSFAEKLVPKLFECCLFHFHFFQKLIVSFAPDC